MCNEWVARCAATVMAITECLIWGATCEPVNSATHSGEPMWPSGTRQRVCPNNGESNTGEDHEQDERDQRFQDKRA